MFLKWLAKGSCSRRVSIWNRFRICIIERAIVLLDRYSYEIMAKGVVVCNFEAGDQEISRPEKRRLFTCRHALTNWDRTRQTKITYARNCAWWLSFYSSLAFCIVTSLEHFAPHILITAPSNVAVDNIVSRILEEGFLDGEAFFVFTMIVGGFPK